MGDEFDGVPPAADTEAWPLVDSVDASCAKRVAGNITVRPAKINERMVSLVTGGMVKARRQVGQFGNKVVERRFTKLTNSAHRFRLIIMATPVIEAAVAERKVVSDIRSVLRKLASSRLPAGVTTAPNLARLADKAFRAEFPVETRDNHLANAMARGIPGRRKLVADEGGSLSAEEAAEEIGISKQAILKRYQKGRIIAWREERQKAVRFPVWQFQEHKVLGGIEESLRVLNAGNRLDDFGRMLFFLSKHGFLGGKRPLDCLRAGELAKVLHAAQGYVA